MTLNGITHNQAFQQYKFNASYMKHGSDNQDKYGMDRNTALSALEDSDYNIDGTLKDEVKANAVFGAQEDKQAKDNPFTEADESKQSRGKDGFEKDPPDCQCETCRRRRYQDGSDDSGVSFQSPTKMSPSKAQYMVKSHEMEHVRREQMSAKQEGRVVVSQSVRIKTATCEECGKLYVAGGETVTVTRPDLTDYRSVLAGASNEELSEAEESKMIV